MSAKADLSEFMALSTSRNGKKPCPVAQALASLEGADAASLTAALDDDGQLVSIGGIAEWLNRRGFKNANVSSITSHKRKTCRCHD